jgi:integrase/recombinase XerD
VTPAGWIDAYLDHLRVERALSSATLEAYGADLARLARHLDTTGVAEVTKIATADICALIAATEGSAKSAARYLSAMRGFFKFLVRERVLERDPTELIDRPRLARRLPKVLSTDEVLRMIEAATQPTRPTLAAVRRAARDRAMLMLLYSSGLRVSELCGLRTQDVDRARGVVSPLGKGQKRRLVPLGEPALDALDVPTWRSGRITRRPAGTAVVFLLRGAGRSRGRRRGS